MDRPEIEFTYVGDTMCSWCWGFAPTLDALQARYVIPMRLVNGGLRPGPSAQVVDDRMRDYLRHHWDQVAAASGQPFDDSVLEREGWVYDTEYPARAVVTMRALAPEHEFDFFKRIQGAFYRDGVDVTGEAAYPALVAEFPIAADAFLANLASEDSRAAAWEDFEEARSLHAAGFPTLLLRTGSDMATVTRGYMPFAAIEPHLTAYLSDRYPPDTFLG